MSTDHSGNTRIGGKSADDVAAEMREIAERTVAFINHRQWMIAQGADRALAAAYVLGCHRGAREMFERDLKAAKEAAACRL